MSHMVIYRGADGKPGYHQTDDIHDAVGFVERMRNEEGVEQARIFRLEEVIFEYKPYFRVELSPSLSSGVEQTSVIDNGIMQEIAAASTGENDIYSEQKSAEFQSTQNPNDNEEEIAGQTTVKKGLFGR